MSEEICFSNYQYQGQVYSPAFSDPPSPSSPMSTTSDTATSSVQSDNTSSNAELNTFTTTDMPPIYNEEMPSSNPNKHIHKGASAIGSTISNDNSSLEFKTNESSSKNGVGCNNIQQSNQNDSNPLQNCTSRLKFPTKYHEMLQPLSPVTTLPVDEVVRRPLPNKTHQVEHDVQLQKQFHSLVDTATSPLSKTTTTTNNEKTLLSRVNSIEDFLLHHSQNIDVNQYNSDGKTALQQCCLAGNLPLVKLLVRFGANMRLTTREGFSVLHIAAFSGHSELLTFVMGQQNGR